MIKQICQWFSCVLILFSSPVYCQTFSGTTGNISDDGQINDFTAAVIGLVPANLDSGFGVVTVCLDITHTYDSDLNMHLVAPDGTEINLISGLGGGDDNFTGTCLSMNAAQNIAAASAPFTGTFKPQETLGNLNNGQPGDGNWILRIVDTYPQDAGIVNSWSITFDTGAAAPHVFLSSNLPILIINTGGVTIPDEPKINATMGIIYNGPGILNHVTDALNDYNGQIGIEMRGAYSQSLPQKPYKIETRDSGNVIVNVSLLGMPPEHDWCLIANYNDKVFMRNVMAYSLFERMGNYSTRTRFCEVVLNGSYQGIYILCESIKHDISRVPIDRLDPNEISGLDVTGGYIIKNDYWDGSNSWLSNFHPIDHQNLNVHLVYHYPNPASIVPQQKTYIQNFINNFETALYSISFADPVNGYRKYMDENSFVDYLIVNELSRNNDGFKKSSYFYKDKDDSLVQSKLMAGPVWDFDWAWKDIPGCFIYEATDGSGWAHHHNDCPTDVNSTGWFVRLMQDTAFQNTFKCRWVTFRNSFLSDQSIHNYIDSVALVLDSAQMRHFEKWGNMGVNTGTPEIEPDPLTFQLHITQFKDWIDRRVQWIDANIPGNAGNCSFAGIEENNSSFGISLFPNPAHEKCVITLNRDNQKINKISICDLSGKITRTYNFTGRRIEINLNDFSSGVYFVKCTSELSSSFDVKKLVIVNQD